MNSNILTVQLPIAGEDGEGNPLPYTPLVRGDTFPELGMLLDEPASLVRMQIRPDSQSFPVMEWTTDGDTATLSEDGLQVSFLEKTPEITKKIRGGTYTGDIEVTFLSGRALTLFYVKLEVLEDYTR